MNYKGLSTKEVEISRKKYGTNSLTKVKGNTFFKLFLESLGDPIIKILLIALAIKMLFLFSKYDVFETIGILVAVLLASLISTISEYGSEASFKRLQSESLKLKAKALRNNIVVEIPSDDIVKDDIILLESGDKIPADGLIVEGFIGADESSLTGESKEIKKSIKEEVLRGSVW